MQMANLDTVVLIGNETKHRKLARSLWKAQDGKCTGCGVNLSVNGQDPMESAVAQSSTTTIGLVASVA